MKIGIEEYLEEKSILLLSSEDKKGSLSELVDIISKNSLESIKNEIEEAICKREELMSTGIGLGIAVPHIRMEIIRQPIIAVGISQKGIKDYESLDGKPVHIIVMIVAGENQHALYIKLLATITSILKDKNLRDKILEVKSPAEIFGILIGN